MRVGYDYQAFIPDVSTVMSKPAPDYEPEHAVLIWSPSNTIPDDKCNFILSHTPLFDLIS